MSSNGTTSSNRAQARTCFLQGWRLSVGFHKVAMNKKPSVSQRNDHLGTFFPLKHSIPSLMLLLLCVSGILRTAVPDMDRETQDQYLVLLQAKDMGGHLGGLSGTTTVTVKLTDVNDNPPRFTQSELLCSSRGHTPSPHIRLVKTDNRFPPPQIKWAVSDYAVTEMTFNY